jgi:hypothetical protein
MRKWLATITAKRRSVTCLIIGDIRTNNLILKTRKRPLFKFDLRLSKPTFDLMITLNLCVLEMSHSKTSRNIGNVTGLCRLVQSLQTDVKAVCPSVHSRFLPNSFHPIIYQPSYNRSYKRKACDTEHQCLLWRYATARRAGSITDVNVPDKY